MIVINVYIVIHVENNECSFTGVQVLMNEHSVSFPINPVHSLDRVVILTCRGKKSIVYLFFHWKNLHLIYYHEIAIRPVNEQSFIHWLEVQYISSHCIRTLNKTYHISTKSLLPKYFSQEQHISYKNNVRH